MGQQEFFGGDERPLAVEQQGYHLGIGTVVDLNIAYKDYPALVRELGKNGFPKEETEDCAATRAERDALAEKLRKIAEILG